MGTSKGVGRAIKPRPGQMLWTPRHLLAITVLVSLVFGSVHGATPAEEAQALETVLTTLNFGYYNASMPACTWNAQAVTCDPTSGLITELNLSSMGLTGSLHPKIGTFQSLILLDLTTYNSSLGPRNNISGPFPDELGNLSQLKYFNFSFNFLFSDFPPVLLRLTNLIDLRVDTTAMSGVIPREINQLKNLEHLFIGNNFLSGHFPAEFGELIHLRELNFHDCQMWGPLPASFGNLINMQKLWLYNNDLTGVVPDSWRNLKSVSDLNIRRNDLSGPIPGFLLQLPSLKRLDISQNTFTGLVPDKLNTSTGLLTVWSKSPLVQNCDISCNYFNGTFPLDVGPNINVTGNCFDNSTKQSDFCTRNIKCDKFNSYYDAYGCVPCPPLQEIYDPANCLCGYSDQLHGKSKLPIAAIAGGIAGFVVVLLVIIALWWYKPIDFKDPFQRKKIDYGPWEIPNGVQRFSLRELTKATNNWSVGNEIGQGGFGKVFHGVFEDGRMVAIKRASDVSMQGTLEFRNEVLLLSRLHHRHLVRLEGFCDEKDLQVLVYEYMEGGNLHDLLAGIKQGRELRWQKRLEIAIGVAQGLDYLHSFADPPVIHRDIKPSNILLDADLVSKVADFGISKESLDLFTHISTRPAGTAGYLDPEYFLRRQLTTASDVYAFGVCLLEIITGQQSIDHMRLEEFNLVEWVKPRFKAGGVEDVVDTALGEDYDKDVLKLMTEVALKCAAVSKNERPTMKEVLNALEPSLPSTLSQDSKRVSEKARELATREDLKMFSSKKSTDSDFRNAGHSRGPSTHTSISSPAVTTAQFDIEFITPR